MTSYRSYFTSGKIRRDEFNSTGFWNGLSDSEKEVFQQATTQGAAHFNQLIVEDEDRSVALAAEHGGKMLQPENRDAWEKGAQGVWQDFAEIVGGFDKIEGIRSVG